MLFWETFRYAVSLFSSKASRSTLLMIPAELRLIICKFALAGTNFDLWLFDGLMSTSRPDEHGPLLTVLTNPDPIALLLVCKTLKQEVSPIFYEYVGVRIDTVPQRCSPANDDDWTLLENIHLPSLCNKIQRLTLSIEVFLLLEVSYEVDGFEYLIPKVEIDQAFPLLRELVVYEDSLYRSVECDCHDGQCTRNMTALVLVMAMLGTHWRDCEPGRPRRYEVLQQLEYSMTQVRTIIQTQDDFP